MVEMGAPPNVAGAIGRDAIDAFFPWAEPVSPSSGLDRAYGRVLFSRPAVNWPDSISAFGHVVRQTRSIVITEPCRTLVEGSRQVCIVAR